MDSAARTPRCGRTITRRHDGAELVDQPVASLGGHGTRSGAPTATVLASARRHSPATPRRAARGSSNAVTSRPSLYPARSASAVRSVRSASMTDPSSNTVRDLNQCRKPYFAQPGPTNSRRASSPVPLPVRSPVRPGHRRPPPHRRRPRRRGRAQSCRQFFGAGNRADTRGALGAA